MSKLNKLISSIEDEINESCHTRLGTFQLGIVLQGLVDRLWDIDGEMATKCVNLQKKLLREEE